MSMLPLPNVELYRISSPPHPYTHTVRNFPAQACPGPRNSIYKPSPPSPIHARHVPPSIPLPRSVMSPNDEAVRPRSGACGHGYPASADETLGLRGRALLPSPRAKTAPLHQRHGYRGRTQRTVPQLLWRAQRFASQTRRTGPACRRLRAPTPR
jgi:hypothetical protein